MKRDGAAALGLALFVFALYAQLLFTNRVAANGDILFYFYPYRALAADALRNGGIPLWNPYIFMGAPFLANPQAAVLYPLHWPLSWLSITQHVYWSAALHTWLLGLGGYALMRTWGLDRGSSLVTGLVLAGSGFYGGLLGHLNQMNGAAWLPWSALVVERTRQSLLAQLALQSPVHTHVLAWPSARWLRRVALPAAGWLGMLVALMLLAGHTQTVYYNLFGLGMWSVAAGSWPVWRAARTPGAEEPNGVWQRARRGGAPLMILPALLGVGCAVGALAAGAQLLPTLELSGLGLRSGGLSYAEASSFSLRPLLLGWTLLPSYGLVDLGVIFGTLGYTEYVAYVGLAGLGLAVAGGWIGYTRRHAVASRPAPGEPVSTLPRRGQTGARAAWAFGLFFVALGFLLALGRWNPLYYLFYLVVPGFDLFRAPARWMMLYTLGMAVLAGAGFGVIAIWLRGQWPRLAAGGLGLLAGIVGLELILAAQALPHTQLTAPQAVYDVRTAPAHLLTDPRREQVGAGGMGRFLSVSAIGFDPGDMADYARIFAESEPPVLNDAAFRELVIALKAQEILAPNLAMLWQIPGVDGFDGGTLPLGRYNEFLTLLIPPHELVPDGRVREQLTQIPPARLLRLLNVEYVITDKVHDLWFEGVYYDRQLGATLTAGAGQSSTHPSLTVVAPYAFPATHIDVIGAVTFHPDNGTDETAGDVPNRRVAQVDVYAGEARVDTLEIVAGHQSGAHWTGGTPDAITSSSGDATVVWRDPEQARQEYRARLPLSEMALADRLEFALTPEANVAAVHIRAVTLYDARTGMFLPLLPSDEGRFELVHSGDVKIYALGNALPRAYVVGNAVTVRDGAAALDYLARPDFDPARVAVVETADAEWLPLASPDSQAMATGRAELVEYHAERVVVQVEVDADTRAGNATAATDEPHALLVLSDVYYPGWEARINGRETPLYQTNHLFRGVVIPPGTHTVEFHFRPRSFQWGMGLSVAGLIAVVGMIGQAYTRRSRG